MGETPPRPALVILAAGASRRLGRCKALVDLDGSTPLERLLRAGGRADGAAPLVVAGSDHAAIAAAAPPGVEVAFNPDWRDGRTGSVRLAAALRPDRDLVLAPVDAPLVPAAVFEALVEAWTDAGAPPCGWLGPRLVVAEGAPPPGAGRHGHPVLLGRELLREVAGLSADTPLRTLRGRATPLWAIEVSWLEILDDLDDESDLAHLQRRLQGG